MANIKSSKKDIESSRISAEKNRAQKTMIATAVKKYKTAIAENNKPLAEETLKDAFSIIDSACTKKAIHKAKADRKKSRLSKMLTKLS